MTKGLPTSVSAPGLTAVPWQELVILASVLVAFGMPFQLDYPALSGRVEDRLATLSSTINEAAVPSTVSSIEIYESSVRVILVSNGDASVVHFSAPSPGLIYLPLVEGRFFAAYPETEAGRVPAGTLESCTSIVQALDRWSGDSTPWERSTSPTNLPPWFYAIAAVLTVLALTIHGLRSTFAVGLPLVRRLWLGLALLGLTMVAFFVRWQLATKGPIHCNLHGFEEIDHLLYPFEAPQGNYMGRAQDTVMDLMFLILPRSLSGLWIATSVLGALLVPAVFWLVSRSTPQRVAPWIAALLVTFSPHAARLSVTESPFLLAGLLLSLSTAAWLTWLANGRAAPLVVALATQNLLVQLHLVTLPFVLLPLAAGLLTSRMPSRREWGALAGSCLFAGILAVPHAMFLFQWAWQHWGHRADSFLDLPLRPLSEMSVFVNTAYTPGLMSLAAVIGMTTFWRKPRQLAGWVVLAGLGGLAFMAKGSISDLVRYQSVPLVIFIVLSALGLSWVVTCARSRCRQGIEFRRFGKRSIAWLLLILSLTALPAWYWHSGRLFLAPDSEAQEWLFLGQVAQDMPEQVHIVQVPRHEGVPPFAWFPRVHLLDQGKAFVLTDVTSPRDNINSGMPTYVYLGLTYEWLRHLIVDPQQMPGPDDVTKVEAILTAAEARFAATEPTRTLFAAPLTHPVDYVPGENNNYRPAFFELRLGRTVSR